MAKLAKKQVVSFPCPAECLESGTRASVTSISKTQNVLAMRMPAELIPRLELNEMAHCREQLDELTRELADMERLYANRVRDINRRLLAGGRIV